MKETFSVFCELEGVFSCSFLTLLISFAEQIVNGGDPKWLLNILMRKGTTAETPRWNLSTGRMIWIPVSTNWVCDLLVCFFKAFFSMWHCWCVWCASVSDEGLRAEMSCGHAVTPESLTGWCRSLLDQVRAGWYGPAKMLCCPSPTLLGVQYWSFLLQCVMLDALIEWIMVWKASILTASRDRCYSFQGQYKFSCPALKDGTLQKCGAEWSYQEVRRLAVLTVEEMQHFEETIAQLAALEYCEYKSVRPPPLKSLVVSLMLTLLPRLFCYLYNSHVPKRVCSWKCLPKCNHASILFSNSVLDVKPTWREKN